MEFSIADLRRWGEFLDYIQCINANECLFIECIIHEDNKVEFIIRPNECECLKFQPRWLGKYDFNRDSIGKIILDVHYKIDTLSETLAQLINASTP